MGTGQNRLTKMYVKEFCSIPKAFTFSWHLLKLLEPTKNVREKPDVLDGSQPADILHIELLIAAASKTQGTNTLRTCREPVYNI